MCEYCGNWNSWSFADPVLHHPTWIQCDLLKPTTLSLSSHTIQSVKNNPWHHWKDLQTSQMKKCPDIFRKCPTGTKLCIAYKIQGKLINKAPLPLSVTGQPLDGAPAVVHVLYFRLCTQAVKCHIQFPMMLSNKEVLFYKEIFYPSILKFLTALHQHETAWTQSTCSTGEHAHTHTHVHTLSPTHLLTELPACNTQQICLFVLQKTTHSKVC